MTIDHALDEARQLLRRAVDEASASDEWTSEARVWLDQAPRILSWDAYDDIERNLDRLRDKADKKSRLLIDSIYDVIYDADVS